MNVLSSSPGKFPKITIRDKLEGAQPETAEELNKLFLNFVCETRGNSTIESIREPVIKLLNGLILTAKKHFVGKEENIWYDWKNHGVLSKAWQESNKLLKDYKEAEKNAAQENGPRKPPHYMYEYLLMPALNAAAGKLGTRVDGDRAWGPDGAGGWVSVLFMIISLIMELLILDVEKQDEIKVRLDNLKKVLSELRIKDSSSVTEPMTADRTKEQALTENSKPMLELDQVLTNQNQNRIAPVDFGKYPPSLKGITEDQWMNIVDTMTDMKNLFVHKKAEKDGAGRVEEEEEEEEE